MSWGDLARAQGGAVTRRQLRAYGLTDHRVDGLLAAGALVAATPGVFAVRGAPGTVEHRLWLAVLATRGVVGFRTAGYRWGVLDECPERIDVIVDHRRRVAVPAGVRVHRVPVPSEHVVRLGRLPVTSRTWTLLDVLGQLPPGAAYRLADRALQRGWLSGADLQARLREYPGRAGNRQLRAVATRCDDGAAAESERILHQLLRRAGVRDWVPNHPVWQGGELIAVVDVALPRARLAIEVDGWAHHSDVDRFLAAAG